MENKVFKGVIGAFIVVASLLGYQILDDDQVYSCDVTGLAGYCFKLSKANADDLQTRCYYDEEQPRRYRICGSGWQAFTQGVIGMPQAREAGISQEICTVTGCVPKGLI